MEKIIEKDRITDIDLVESNYDYQLVSSVADNSGIWEKFPRHSYALDMYEKIKDRGLEWEVAQSLEDAKYRLDYGDFYIYFVKDEEGNYTIPKALISFICSQLFEVRGTNLYQALDKEYIYPVFQEFKEISKEKEKNYYEGTTVERYHKLATIRKNPDWELDFDSLSNLWYGEPGFKYFYASAIHGVRSRQDDMKPVYRDILMNRDIVKDLQVFSEKYRDLYSQYKFLNENIGNECNVEEKYFDNDCGWQLKKSLKRN